MSFDAVCVGDNCIDHYLPPVNRRFVGGNAVNVAVHLQRNGIAASYVGVVGDDADGQRVLDALRQEGVNVAQVQVLPGESARTDIWLGANNDREFVYEYLGPKPAGYLTPEAIAFVARHRLVHTTFLGGVEDDLPAIVRAGAALISMDYGERYTPEFVEKTIGCVALAFFSLPEARSEEAGALARHMHARGLQLAVVTMGYRGSLTYDGRGAHFQPALPVAVFDTLGAGDAYIGAFLAHYLHGNSIPQCMERATQSAAQACAHYGAWLPQT